MVALVLRSGWLPWFLGQDGCLGSWVRMVALVLGRDVLTCRLLDVSHQVGHIVLT